MAYHSHHMRKVGEQFETALSEAIEHAMRLGLVDRQQTHRQVRWVSSVHPEKDMSSREATPKYRRSNLENPVQFLQAVRAIVENEDNGATGAFVEIGPHPALKGPLGRIIKSCGANFSYTPSLRRGEDSLTSLLHLAGTLFCLNAPINMALVNSIDEADSSGDLTLVHGCTSSDLPPYQHTYGPIRYFESRASREFRFRRFARHDLIGSKMPGTAGLKPQWRNVLRVKDLPWLKDHCVMSEIVFPAACYVAMAIEVASQSQQYSDTTHSIGGFTLRDVVFRSMLRLPDDDYGVEVMTTLDLDSGSWMGFTISSVAKDTDKWSEHCSGLIKIETRNIATQAAGEPSVALDARTLSPTSWYKNSEQIGLRYGPAFQGLRSIQADPIRGIAIAQVSMNTTAADQETGTNYVIHPGSLDSAFQLALIACYSKQADPAQFAYLPTHIDVMYLSSYVLGPVGNATAQGELRGLRGAYATLQMQNDLGDVIVHIQQLRCTVHGAPGKKMLRWLAEVVIPRSLQQRG